MKNILLVIVLVIVAGAIVLLQKAHPGLAPAATTTQSLTCPIGQERNAAGDCVAATAPEVTPPTATEPTPTPAAVNPVPAATPTPKPSTATQYLSATEKARQFQSGVELAGISGYLNLPAGNTTITLSELVGKKVILVDFWTYSCINCQRTLPYLNAWYDKYHDQGLEIIGVHTPEFAFEKEYANVAAAIAKYNIKYPVVQDNDYATWTAYKNRYWPRKYLIDIDGYIVLDHIGEGGYAETEKAIQLLLAERAHRLGLNATISSGTVQPTTTSGGYAGPLSPETYFGSSRNSNYLGSSVPASPAQNGLYLTGSWNIMPEYATNQTAGSKVVFKYIAQQVFFVAHGTQPITVQILRDGQPLTADIAGEDVTIANGMSTVTISEARLYKLIKETSHSEHTLELIPQAAGLEAFTFTFG